MNPFQIELPEEDECLEQWARELKEVDRELFNQKLSATASAVSIFGLLIILIQLWSVR